MNNDNHYNQGYEYFQNKNNTPLTPELLKQSHPLFRRGYRTAQEDYVRKNHKSIPMVLADIPKIGESFDPSWNDILAATRRPRMSKLHAAHMAPMLNMLIKSVENNKHKIKRYSDVVRMVDEGFDIILQYGYDSGILNEVDLGKYNYSPK